LLALLNVPTNTADWWTPDQEKDNDGLQEESLRPKPSPEQKNLRIHMRLIYALRKCKFRLNSLHDFSLSTATVYKALERHNKQHMKQNELLENTPLVIADQYLATEFR